MNRTGGSSENSSGGAMVPKWMLLVLGLFFVVYAVTVLATGEPTFLIPVAILAALVFAYAAVIACSPSASSSATAPSKRR